MDSETSTALLRGEHFSMADRIACGAWSHPPILFSDLVRRVAYVLEQGGCCAGPSGSVQSGESLPEDAVVERQSENRYIDRWQRPLATNPYVLAEQGERVFRTAVDATHHYLVCDRHLPGDLDGWQVVR